MEGENQGTDRLRLRLRRSKVSPGFVRAKPRYAGATPDFRNLMANKGFLEMALRSGPPVFRADHPFMFLIRHNASGGILLLGRVVNPVG